MQIQAPKYEANPPVQASVQLYKANESCYPMLELQNALK